MINQTIKLAIQGHTDELIEIRRKIHSEPEISWEEYKTTDYVYSYLENLGIQCRKTDPTGVIAEIKGGKPGKTVALRGDMDAFSVQELNKDLSYASKEDGKMHACGHDAHTAMLLVAAKTLNEIKDDLPGNVRLLFQPAEEIAEGAKSLVKQGAMEGVDNVFGIHIWSQIPTGKVSCSPGPSFAAADRFIVTFKGRGGHGAMPHDCIDAAVIASSFVMNIQSVISRTIDPQESAVLTVGKMTAGTRFNVIAENAEIEGTIRCFNPAVQCHIETQIKTFADMTAALYGASAKVNYIRGTQAVLNEASSAKLVQNIVSEAFGVDKMLEEKPTMGGEDFSVYLENVPGAFSLVGCGNSAKDTQWSHHHGLFNIDEDALIIGAELYAQYAWGYLKST